MLGVRLFLKQLSNGTVHDVPIPNDACNVIRKFSREYIHCYVCEKCVLALTQECAIPALISSNVIVTSDGTLTAHVGERVRIRKSRFHRRFSSTRTDEEKEYPVATEEMLQDIGSGDTVHLPLDHWVMNREFPTFPTYFVCGAMVFSNNFDVYDQKMRYRFIDEHAYCDRCFLLFRRVRRTFSRWRCRCFREHRQV